MNIAVIGQGGHSKVIQELIHASKRHRIIGIFDDKYEDIHVNKNRYYGPIDLINKIIPFFDNLKFILAIGNNRVRKSIFEKMGIPKESFVTLIHESAVISPSAKIGHGTVILAKAVINANTEIGDHAIINTGSIIEHDNQLGSFVHVSPHATLTGDVKLEEGVHVGAGATLIPNVKIGDWSTIGAGATVVRNIPAHCTAVGVPAKVLIKEGV